MQALPLAPQLDGVFPDRQVFPLQQPAQLPALQVGVVVQVPLLQVDQEGQLEQEVPPAPHCPDDCS